MFNFLTERFFFFFFPSSHFRFIPFYSYSFIGVLLHDSVYNTYTYILYTYMAVYITDYTWWCQIHMIAKANRDLVMYVRWGAHCGGRKAKNFGAEKQIILLIIMMMRWVDWTLTESRTSVTWLRCFYGHTLSSQLPQKLAPMLVSLFRSKADSKLYEREESKYPNIERKRYTACAITQKYRFRCSSACVT